MKLTLILAISLAVNTTIYSQQDIKEVSWGMHLQEVMDSETQEFYDSLCPTPTYCLLYYKDILFGDSAFIAYEFYADTLRLYSYLISSNVTYGKEYTFLLKYLNDLTTRYHEPDQIAWNWKRQSYKYKFNESPQEGDNLFNYYFSSGDLKSVSYSWRLPEMMITLSTYLNVQNDGKKWPSIVVKYSAY